MTTEASIIRYRDLEPSWHLLKAREPGNLRWITNWVGGAEGYINANPSVAAISDRYLVGLMCLPMGNRQPGIHAHSVTEIYVVVSGELDGRRTAHDLGLDGMLNRAGGYIGEAGMQRPGLAAPGRLQLVGLEALEGAIPEGAMLLCRHGKPAEGHVTAAACRAVERDSIALALLAGGQSRHGEELVAHSPTRRQQARVRVVAPHFYDPSGERYRD